MTDVQIPIINLSPNPLPSYATPGSAGMDLRAYLTESVLLKPLERHLIPTGIFIQLPEHFEAQIRPRSGMAYKQGITCLNSPGTIDSDYRGEIKVLLVNLSNETQEISNGDRIAQLIVAKTEKVMWKVVDAIDESSRGEGGFGHTGKK